MSKILAIDTATEACSAALYIDGNVTHTFEVSPQQHSQKLLPMVEGLLTQAELNVNQLDYLCFGRGPGSFTGVRIATGMIQGMALGADLPVVGVSTLQAMAQEVIASGHGAQVAVAIDARMGEVYFALFANQDGVATLVGQEVVCPPEEVLPQLNEEGIAYAGTGWQAYPVLSELVAQYTVTVLYPSAQFMFASALQSIAQGEAKDIEEITPTYLRDKVTWKKLPGRE